ncbi:MAG: hypothetical protein ACRCVJ_12235 [Clostridium sp.]|uniref:hypothetical protein n=1 Tax=Clostridium sp. TaxID=1506 RepID=UPI003F40CC05
MDDRNFILLLGTFISVILIMSKFMTNYFSKDLKGHIIKKPGEQNHINIFMAWIINTMGIVDIIMSIYLFCSLILCCINSNNINEVKKINNLSIEILGGFILIILLIVVLILPVLFILMLLIPTMNMGIIYGFILKEFIYQLKNQELRGNNENKYEKEKKICNIGAILTGIGSAIFTIWFWCELDNIHNGGKSYLVIFSFIGLITYMSTYCLWKALKNVIKDLEDYRLFYLFDKNNKIVVVTSLYIEVDDRYVFYKSGIRCSILKSEIITIFCEDDLNRDIKYENRYSIKFKKIYNWLEKIGETKLFQKFKETDFFKIIT